MTSSHQSFAKFNGALVANTLIFKARPTLPQVVSIVFMLYQNHGLDYSYLEDALGRVLAQPFMVLTVS